MNLISYILLAAIVFVSSARAQDADFTKRVLTDPLLKVTTRTIFLPGKEDSSMRAARDDKHVPPVYRHIWGQNDVIMLEAFSLQKAAEIVFSAITKDNKGILRIGARNHPAGDFMLEILKNGQSIKKELVASSKWERYTVPFDHEEVVLKAIANNWNFEFAFIDYSFTKVP